MTSADHLTELRAFPPGSKLPGHLTQAVARLRKKPDEERNPDDVALLKAYAERQQAAVSLRASKVHHEEKHEIVHSEEKREITLGDLRIAETGALADSYRSLSSLLKTLTETASKDKDNVSKWYGDLVKNILETVREQGAYIAKLHEGRVKLEKQRDKAIDASGKLLSAIQEKEAEITALHNAAEEDGDALTKIMEGDNLEKFKDLIGTLYSLAQLAKAG